MNREETKKAAEVMMGFAEGKEVEYRRHTGNDRWFPGCADNILWNWDEYEYRLKPTPRTWYAVEHFASADASGIGPLHHSKGSASAVAAEYGGKPVIELVEVIR